MMDLTFEAKCMPFLFQAINIIKAPNCECEIINTGHSKGGLCTRFRILTRVGVGSIVCISQYRRFGSWLGLTDRIGAFACSGEDLDRRLFVMLELICNISLF